MNQRLNKKVLALLLFSFLFYPLISQELESKKYYYNFFSGGIPEIKTIYGNSQDIECYSIYYNIVLFNNYSKVEVTIKIKNNGKKSRLEFLYPKLDARIKKEITSNKKVRKSNQTISGDYINYNIKIDGNTTKFEIIKDDILELLFPYKTGDYIHNKNDTKEIVDSFNFYYGWYKSIINIEENEKKVIKISYIAPHYYNKIIYNKSRNKEVLSEDPALDYVYYTENNKNCFESEKIFMIPLHTSYMKENIIDKIKIKLTANLIDQNYLKISPMTYRKRRKTYRWSFKNEKAEPIKNILVKISPKYSAKTINLNLFRSEDIKTGDDYRNFFEFSNNDRELVLEYSGNDNESVEISKVKIMPQYFFKKKDLKEHDNPLTFEISFADNENFYNSKSFIKHFRKKKFISLVNKKSYVEIYDDDPIKCKFIKIRILKSSLEGDKIRISDIQFLK